MHQKFHSTQTWTFKGRTQTITSQNRPSAYPGPSDYSSSKQLKNFGTAVIGKDKRQLFEQINETPGPGTYNTKSFISDGPKRSMSARIPTHFNQTPGPSKYHPNYLQLKAKQPQYTMLPKRNTEWNKKQSQLEPAPNLYNPQQISPTKSVYLSKTSRKKLDEYQTTPGPAAYDSNDLAITTRSQTTKIGSERRKQLFSSKIHSPAPNTYRITGFSEIDKLEKKGFTMRPRTANPFESSKRLFPGPGNYNINRSNSKIKGFANGNDKRKTFIDDTVKSNVNPSAAQYSPSLTKSTECYSFNNSSRKKLSEYESTPGPAKYNMSASTNLLKSKAPGYSMSRSTKGLKQFFDTKQGIPAPNKYSSNYNLTKQSSKVIQMSKSKWLKQGKGLDSPGVGSYKIDSFKGNGQTFKKDKRNAFTDSKVYKDNPGPSQYNIQSSFLNPPKYMMSGTYKSKS